MLARIAHTQKQIGEQEAWLISNQAHIEYLTGFVSLLPTERESFLWLTRSSACLIHASFSPAPHSKEITFLQGCYANQLVRHIQNLLTEEPIQLIVIDGATLWHDEYRALVEATQQFSSSASGEIRIIERKKHQLSGAGSGDSGESIDFILSARTKKDGIEIAAIHLASQVAAQAVAYVQSILQPGMSEQHVCRELETKMRSLGSTAPAFPTIVAFGKHTALPHHQPTTTKLEEEMAVLIDCGATVDRYRSDMTRSWWFGPETSKPTEYATIEATVYDAYQAGIAALSQHFTISELTKLNTRELNTREMPQATAPTNQSNHTHIQHFTAAQLDSECRKIIQKAGYAGQFIHTTGHGVGLDIHEAPSISGSNTTPLEAGMVITIEPGIYLQDQYGFRYENTILIDLIA